MRAVPASRGHPADQKCELPPPFPRLVVPCGRSLRLKNLQKWQTLAAPRQVLSSQFIPIANPHRTRSLSCE